MTGATLLTAARQAGIELRLDGARIQFRPFPPPPEAVAVIEQLRQHRAELAIALAASAPDWREGSMCPACFALRWLDRQGRRRCDCGCESASPMAAPAPTDHAGDCTCTWCRAWNGRRFQPIRYRRDWTPCACGGDHRPCGITGRCGLACPCGLCAGWRKAMGYGESGGVQ